LRRPVGVLHFEERADIVVQLIRAKGSEVQDFLATQDALLQTVVIPVAEFIGEGRRQRRAIRRAGDVGELVAANGDWTVIIAPVASAPELPASGTGDGVYLYDGPAPIWQITHSGSSNFSVVEKSPSSLFGLLVNEIGTYDGSVTGVAGPSVIIISADGDWTFQAQ
jgi:hypothetical protein